MSGRRLWWLAGLAAAVPFVRAGAAGGAFAVRASLADRRGVPMYSGVPTPAPTATLAAAVALDELLLMPMGLFASAAPEQHYARSSAELDAAVRFYEAHGWLDDPSEYFSMPEAPREVDIVQVQRRRGPLEVLRFDSGWEPRAGEPGHDRWVAFEANRQVHAAILRHDGGPRPWLIALHGQGMGRLADADLMRMRRVHHELGVNVLLPVAPLHGPRRAGLRPEQQFVSNVYPVNNVLGLSQAMWDLRRLLTWLRETEAAPAVGILGFSLGSLTAALLSTLEGDLACVIAVVPSGDLAAELRAAEPLLPAKRRAHRTVHDWRSDLVHRVVSPLAMPCRVPKEGRFIVAGQGDRVASPPGAVLLWRHWDEPAINWRPRGHLTTAFSAEYDNYLDAVLRQSGLTGRPVVAI